MLSFGGKVYLQPRLPNQVAFFFATPREVSLSAGFTSQAKSQYLHINQLETFTSLEAFDQYVKRHEQEFRTSPFALQISAICQAKRAHFAQPTTYLTN